MSLEYFQEYTNRRGCNADKDGRIWLRLHISEHQHIPLDICVHIYRNKNKQAAITTADGRGKAAQKG